MAVTSTARPQLTEYPAIFRGYIVNSTHHILARVEQAQTVLLPADRAYALHTLTFAFKLPEAWPDTRGLLLSLAPKMEQAGYRDEWLPYLEQGLQQSQQLDDVEASAELQLWLGMLYQLRGKYEAARSHLEASAAEFERSKARRNRARALNRLAYLARLQRQFEEATGLVETARRLLDHEDEEWGYSNYVLGLIALDERDWQRAVDFSKKSLENWQRADNRRLMGRSLLCLGTALEKMKQYPQALTVCQQAIALFEEIQDPFYRAIAQMNLGNVYVALNQLAEALQLYGPAERIFRQVQDQFHLALITHNIGMVYRRMREWKKTEEAFLLSIKHQEAVGNVAWLVNTLDGLGMLYLDQGQAAAAMDTFEEALNRLSQIKGEPSYDHLLDMVSGHVEQAREKVVDP